MSTPPHFRAVIFDLDGTLLDTLHDIADAMNAALAAQGFPTHAYAAYQRFIGDGMETLAHRVLPERTRNPETIQLMVAGMRAEYGRRWADKSKPYAGIDDLLRRLRELALPMAVLSNKPHDFTLQCIARMLPEHRFAAAFGSREGVPKKPDPAGALEVARLLRLAPEQCLYIGDTDTDMKTARAANMYAVGALWGFRSAEELSESGAQTLINEPLELLQLLA